MNKVKKWMLEHDKNIRIYQYVILAICIASSLWFHNFFVAIWQGLYTFMLFLNNRQEDFIDEQQKFTKQLMSDNVDLMTKGLQGMINEGKVKIRANESNKEMLN